MPVRIRRDSSDETNDDAADAGAGYDMRDRDALPAGQSSQEKADYEPLEFAKAEDFWAAMVRCTCSVLEPE